jgi:hypothetical protein
MKEREKLLRLIFAIDTYMVPGDPVHIRVVNIFPQKYLLYK